MKRLHAEYRDEQRSKGGPFMSYDRFCKRYREFTVSKQVVSRVGHKAGRIMEVDWAGPTMPLVDPATGEVSRVYLFVACLPFSRLSYVEPTLDMRQDTWLRCHVHAFAYMGGSTPCIVPDNLKTGVKGHPREGEVELNGAYREMAAHYGSAVMPARVRTPRDKPSVENEVWQAATEIVAALRDTVFTDFNELRRAVAARLEEHNSRPFSKREGTRREVFEEQEGPLLRPLPAVPYEVCEWVYGRKVQKNCHVAYKHNYYSVSHLAVGRTVDLRVTDTTVEVFLAGERLATHPLFPASARNRYSTHAESAPFPLTHGVPFRHDAANGERGHRMGHPSPKYSAEFKQQAVRLYRERGGTYAEIARELGVDAGSISDWVKRADAAQASPEDNPFKVAEENRRLRREVERLRRENEILLKASAFFASRQL